MDDMSLDIHFCAFAPPFMKLTDGDIFAFSRIR